MGRFAHSFALLNEDGLMVSEQGEMAPTHPTMPLVAALTNQHADDAHFTCYHVRNRATRVPEARAPRIAKSAIAFLSSSLAPPALKDAEVYGHVLALDFDLPEPGCWTDADRTNMEEIFAGLAAKGSILATPTLFYTTAGGFRLIWALAESVPVEGVRGLEDLLAGLVAEAHIQGLAVDPMCRDWTRLFRLPCVRRRDKGPAEERTWLQPYFRMSWGKVDLSKAAMQVTAPGQVRVFALAGFKGLSERTEAEFQGVVARRLYDKWKGRVGQAPRQSSVLAEALDIGQQPDHADCQALLYIDGIVTHPTHRFVRVRRIIESLANPRALSARPVPAAVHAVEVCLENRPLFDGAEAGVRGMHEGIGRLSRALCLCLWKEMGEGPGQVSAQFLHALVLRSALAINAVRAAIGQADSDSELAAEVWRFLSYTYRQFRFQASERLRQQEEAEADNFLNEENRLAAEHAQEQAIIKRLKTWIRRDPSKGDTVSQAHLEWVDANWRKLLVVDAPGLGTSVLSINPGGEVVYSAPVPKLGNVFAAVRDSGHLMINILKQSASAEGYKTEQQLLHEYSTNAIGSKYSRLEGDHRIQLVPDRDGLAPIFVRKLPGMRQDITPKYDPVVEQWLSILAGDMAEKLFDWLAAFGRIDKPCCGLYIQGDASVGKGMLGLALTNMTFSAAHAKLESALEQFQDTMMRTPFVWGDEEASTPTRASRSMMNTYKKLISGEFDTLNAKGVAAQPVEGHWRVYISSNTGNFLKMDEDLDRRDLKAIVLRCLHINGNPEAEKFLLSLGGRGDKPGEGTNGWPEANIPGHIAWLAANRIYKEGNRFLIEGVDSEYHERLANTSEVGGAVLRGVGRCLEDPDRNKQIIHIHKGEVYVFTAGLLQKLKEFHAQDPAKPRLTPRTVGNSIQHLSADKQRASVWVQAAGEAEARPHHAWRLNLVHVLRQLHLAEVDCDFRKALGEARWREVAPPDVIAMVDAPVPEEYRRKPGPPAPPKPEWMNGHTNGSSNGHHPAPAHAGHGPAGHIPSSQPFVGAPPLPPQPPPLPGLN